MSIVTDLLTQQRERVELEQARLAATVSQARQAGLTWAQIGEALGVSKQAAQQRYGP